MVWQHEKVDTDHIQGYIELTAPVKLGGMRSWLEGAHFETRKGTAEQARDYCMEEDTRVAGPWERGHFNGKQGKREDLEEFKAAVREGKSKRELLEEHSLVFAKYPRFVTEYQRLVQEESVAKIVAFHARYKWQEKILTLVKEVPNDRHIHWVYDPVGNHGKTYLAKYLVQEYKAYYTNGGKAVDLTFAYCGEPIVIFDYVRDAKEYVGYGVIEQLKNGILFSSKYESGLKRFDVPHVIVFANFRPAEDKFSIDRLQVMELNSIGEII